MEDETEYQRDTSCELLEGEGDEAAAESTRDEEAEHTSLLATPSELEGKSPKKKRRK